MSRIRQKIRSLCSSQQGVTLVELIVTFALTGILMAASAAVLTSGLRLYTRMTVVAQAELTANLVLEQIAGTLFVEGLPEEEMEVDDKGYEIEHLSFTRDDPEEHPDVVRIDLTLKHRQSGYTYSTFRYVESSGSDQEDEILLQ